MTSLTPDSGEKTVWVVMRSRKEKATVDDGKTGNRPSGAMRLYGYERIQNMVPAFFMPMKESVTTKGGRRIKRTAPAIPDIFFVKDTIEHLDTIVKRGIGVEYLFVKGLPYRQPVIIRDSEMENFIAATTASQRVTFHTAGSDTLTRLIGRRVRIPHADTFIEGEAPDNPRLPLPPPARLPPRLLHSSLHRPPPLPRHHRGIDGVKGNALN